MKINLEKKVWWGYIEEDLRDLFRQGYLLYEMSGFEKAKFRDYSFVVFPAAKALNPTLEMQYRQESVYDKIVNHCGGKTLADKLWQTWILSRNSVFHWFPKEKKALSLDEAKIRIDMIIEAMDAAVMECKIK